MSSSPDPSARPRVYTRAEQRHALTASFLGWTLDAFDFFILVFMMDRVAAEFHVTKTAIVATLTATLALRPVGALIFGMLADRYGRRRPLMANVIYFSLVEFGCAFAPNYTVFLVLRSLYGIGMGGEWGVGASLAMEIAPRRWRGVLSGILQSGYSIGYLLAALCARLVLPAWGWRPMFWLGGVPALLALYIRMRVPESEAWQQNRAASVVAILRTVVGHARSFVYLVVLMTLMMFLSHGTQDLYPDFLKTVLLAAVPEPGPWVQARIIHSKDDTRVFQRPTPRLGETEQTAKRFLAENQRFTEHTFSASLPPLTSRFFLIQAELKDAHGVDVKLKIDGAPSDAGLVVTVPAAGKATKVEARRLSAEGTVLPGIGRDYRAVWFAVFNADAGRETQFQLGLTLRKDVRGMKK